MTGVRTVADLDACFQRGAAGSIGWPMDGPAPTKPRPLQAGQAAVLEALQLVQQDADVSRIDAVLRRDPALVFKLLRLVNSAGTGLAVQVTSLQHAVAMLGYRMLKRWLAMMAAGASKDANAAPLMRASILRGLFLEQLGAETGSSELRDELFIAGAFSLLDRVTGAPFARLFELVALPENITDAVLHRSGPCAPYLALVEAIERGDAIAVRDLAESVALPLYRCNSALLRALATAATLQQDSAS